MAVASHSSVLPENAFHEIMDPPASPSATLKKGPYDVFINHRGPDVKSKLASSIHHVLDLVGITAFFDREELDLGDLIPQAIQHAMHSALIHIAIFSRNYAASPWCLAELSFMLETEATIIPIFYDVQPADLRWVDSQETYAQAFEKHRARGRYPLETLQKWKNALNKISYYKGHTFWSNGDDEGILLKRIVERVRREIKNAREPFEEATHPVGLDGALQDLDAIISAPGRENVQIVGIVGMSGCGKTTLASELYKQKHKAFNNCSFLHNVRQDALHELQKKLLEDLVYQRNLSLRGVSEGKSVLAGRLRSLRVLIVLDDVDDCNQLDALLPEKGRTLGRGSLIVVTTCSSDVLRGRGTIYKMRTLNRRHAEELFCRHAFLQPSAPKAFENLVQSFIRACDGLPLSIKVIAEMLYEKPEEEWKINLKKISRLLPSKIKDRLMLGYEALDEEEKAIFLDIACFFVGEKKNLAIAVWDAAEWSGLENLVNKCLVEIDKQDRIRMHSHFRDLGREIAMKSPPHRVWYRAPISKMKYREERMSIRGIMAAATQLVVCPGHDELPKCCDPYEPPLEECMNLGSLELLIVTGEHFTSLGFAGLSKRLAWLRLFDFQDAHLPSCLSVTNLRVLELYGASRLQLWENNAHPPEELREIIITATKGKFFYNFPSNVSGLKHLTKIALISEDREEFRFKKLPDELCNLLSLKHLELRHCKLLTSLPTDFGKLKRLQHLDLCSCEMLWKLPNSFKELADLEYLDLSGCKKLVPMPDIFEKMTRLKNLYFSGRPKLEALPVHITNQQALGELHLLSTMLRNLPCNISQLDKLETLRIGSPHLSELPTSLGDLSSLTNLEITGCAKLQSLPPLQRLNLLESLCLEDCGVKCLPEGFSRLTNLQSLKIFDCPVAELDFGLASSSGLGKLKMIHLKATDVKRVSISQNCCPSLETLQLEQNYDLTEIDILSNSLKMVRVYKCTMLRNIKGLTDLVNPETLEIEGCPSLDQDILVAVRRADNISLPPVTSDVSTPFRYREWLYWLRKWFGH